MNVIIVSLDTTRADRLSCYGHHRRTSPHIDRVAEEGVLFTDHFSPHIPTYPGHTTLMTGRDIYAHHVTSQSHTPEPTPGVRMLAEILRDEGYHTGAADNLGRWFARGFDDYRTYAWDTSAKRSWRKGEAVASAALDVLDAAAAQDRPFFLFFHFWDPHTPYLPPPPFDRMFYRGDEKEPGNDSMAGVWSFEALSGYFAEWMPGVTDIEFPKAQYDAEIAYMDACFASVLTRMDELGVSGDTLLVLTADHGEELDEHGRWFDHHGLYDTNIHIPLLLRCPDRLPAGRRVGGLTTMLDVAPTILDILGLGHLASVEQMQGRSLMPLIDSPVPTQRGTTDYIHITENTWMKKRGIRTHRWKLIVPLEVPDLHGNTAVELYHLTDDPAELNNIAAERPEVVERMTRLLDEWVEARLAETGLPDPLPLQPIPLRRIGKMESSVPNAKSPTDAIDDELSPAGPAASGRDAKLPDGDFVGYEREESP
jgi:arylsulfatase A-like enzyme